MNKLSIVVTGAGGFIGRALVPELAGRGHRVFALGRNLSSLSGKNVQVLDTDLGSPIRLPARQIDAVVHLAVRRPGAGDDLIQTLRSNLIPFRSVLQFSTEKKVPHVVYCSSAEVYKPLNRKLAEGDPTGPKTDFALAKLLGETLCKPFEMESRSVVTITRFPSVYGPGENPRGLVGLWIQQAREGKPILLAGDGNERLDCVYIRDVIQGILLVLEKRPAGILNIGSGSAASLKTIASTVSKVFGGKVKVSSPRAGTHTSAGSYLCLDIRKAEREIGFKPAFDIKSGCVHYRDSLRNPPSNGVRGGKRTKKV